MSQFIQMVPSFEKFFAVEANPYLAGQLRAACPDPRIEILQCVVRHIAEPYCMFHLDKSNEVSSSCVFENYNGNPWEAIEARCISCRSLVESLEAVDLVKMDIEGSEWEILDGWDQGLAETVSQLTVEFHDFVDPNRRHDTLRCIDRLRSLGYKVQSRGTHWGQGSEFYDVLFYKEDGSRAPSQ